RIVYRPQCAPPTGTRGRWRRRRESNSCRGAAVTRLAYVLALACLACAPPAVPTPGGLAVTGQRLAPDELQLLDTWHRDVRQCLSEHDHSIARGLRTVHVHPGCWLESGRRWVRGSADMRGGVNVGRDLRAFRHEAAHTLSGSRSHAPESPTILCEHAGETRPPPFECEPDPRALHLRTLVVD